MGAAHFGELIGQSCAAGHAEACSGLGFRAALVAKARPVFARRLLALLGLGRFSFACLLGLRLTDGCPSSILVSP